MKSIPNVSVFSLEANIFGNITPINPVLIWDADGATLIDAGCPGMFDQIQQAITKVGVPVTEIKRVIITHQDWDHIGILPDISQAWGNRTEVLAHTKEKPYIEGTLPNIKMTPERIAARLEAMPADMRAKAAVLFHNLPTGNIHKTVEDGELLPIHGGIQVIHTPGHTPGHICLYLQSHRLLIAGDQLRVEEGRLCGPSPIFTVDMPTALESLKKLVNYDISRVICYHGGNYETEVKQRIAELATGKA